MLSSAARSGLVPIVALIATSLALLLPCRTACALGQAQQELNPPTQVLEGSPAFTETVADMIARDDQYVLDVVQGRLQPPPRHRVINHRKRRVPRTGTPGAEGVFPPPPFIGPSSSAERDGRVGWQSLGPGFAGIGLSDEISYMGTSYIPPDTMGAVGPAHVVEILNGSVNAYNKSTGSRVYRISINNFFSLSSGGVSYPRHGAFDPRALYDRHAGRYFLCALEFGPYIDVGNPSLGTENNHVILAVSATSDPTGAWSKYVIPIGKAGTPGATYFSDFDTLGVDSNGVYVAITLFRNETGSFDDIKLVATPKGPLVAPTPSLGTVSVFTGLDTYATPQPAHNLDAVGPSAPAWIVASYPYDYSNVAYYTLTWNAGTPALSSPQTLSTPAFSAPMTAPAQGSSPNIDAGDMRMSAALIRNGRLWCARTVGVNSSGTASGANRTGCEWFELNLSGTTASVVQNGRVYDPAASNPRFYYYPSIAANGQGHVAMGFSGSKSNEYVGAYVTERLAGDAAGTMRSITLMKAGLNSYSLTYGGSLNRWGDYSFTGVDPSDDMTLWTIQEYATSSANRWGTWINPILAPAPTLSNPNAHANQGASGVVLNLTGTGFYEPGPSFSNHLAVAFTGGSPNGISNVAVTVNSSTSLTVTLDVSGSAQAGARDIVVTNPDGQLATVVGGLTIDAGDGTPPVTTATVSGTVGGGGWYRSDVTVDLAATDAGSGVARVNYRIDGGSTVTVPGSAAQAVLTTDGQHLVEFWAEDNASNVEATQSVSPMIDRVAPTTTAALVGAAVELDSQDAPGGSGVDAVTYRIDGGAWQTYSGPIDVGLAAHLVEFYATDVAGNVETTGSLAVADRREATSVTVTQPLNGTVGESVTLSALLAETAGGAPLAAKQLRFTVEGIGDVGTGATGPDGVAQVDWTIPEAAAGSRMVTATFDDGDAAYAPASGTGTLDAAKAATRVWVRSVEGAPGDAVEVAATLLRLSDDARIQGRSISITIGTWTVSGSTDAQGTLKRTYIIPSSATPGTQPISAAFSAADAAYLPSSGAGTLTVGRSRTKTWVRSLSGSPGQTVQLAATLMKNANSERIPGRTLTLTIGAWQGSGVTDAIGTVFINYPIPVDAALGTQTITAAFAGDTEFQPSSKNGGLTAVKAATKIWVRSPSGMRGSTVELAATLSRKWDGLRIPGRTLTFTIGAWTGMGVTDALGTVRILYTIPVWASLGANPITVEFADAADPAYGVSSNTGTLTVTQ